MKQARRSPSRQLFGRSLLLFGLLLLGPAVGLSIVGWRSVQQEHRFRLAEMERTAGDALGRRLNEAARLLEDLRRQEGERPYYHYQERFLSADTALSETGGQYAFQTSPLVRERRDRRVVGWFQWRVGPRGPYGTPEIYPHGAPGLHVSLLQDYAAYLKRVLARASQEQALLSGEPAMVPLRVVIANAERGQLLEELRYFADELNPVITQNRQAVNVGGIASSSYLDDLARRVGPEQVPVYRTPFRWVAGSRYVGGPPLLAYRLVRIPAVYPERRRVEQDEYVLQGFAIDLSQLVPGDWEQVGTTMIGRRDRVEGEARLAQVRGSLADVLRAPVVGSDETTIPRVSPALVLLGRADYASAEQALSDARGRFFLLVLGLAVVVGLGFFILARGVRREVMLARRKEDFIAAITHELKTPLTGIRMYADMLKAGWVKSTEGAQEYAENILGETQRLGHLVDQVLDLAALERGVATVNAQIGDLGETVRDAVTWMESKAREADVALTVEIEPGCEQVSFDPKLVRPLVLNLVDNAIKYSQRSETRSVAVHLAPDGERAVLRVSDKGVGMDATTRKLIFQPFQRAGDELTRDAPGIGIGLALVRRYADAHRARLQVESEPGEGTTVTVRFPMRGSGS